MKLKSLEQAKNNYSRNRIIEQNISLLMPKLLKNETFLSILLISLTTIITYGLSIPRFGYYHDDWFLLWSGAARGAESIIPLFSTDRPFMGVVYSLVYRLLGDASLNWHLYALLWRFIGGLAFFWILRLLWPRQKYLAALMTVLFIVYPGFLSQPNANTKQNHLFGFGTALLSIAFMLQALKTSNRVQKILYNLISLVLTVNYLFIYEYMIGLEGMRLALLVYALLQSGYHAPRVLKGWRTVAVETVKRWWPYPLAMAGFLYWRIFLFDGARNATDASRLAGDYASNLRSMLLRLGFETFRDFFDTTIFAWVIRPYRALSGTEYSNLASALLIATVVIGLVFAYSFLIKKTGGDDESNHQPIRDLLLLGAFTTLCAVLPVVASGRDVNLSDAYKSYGLHPMAGAVLFVTGLVLMLRPKFRRIALLTLIGLAVLAQAANADYWAQLWDYQRETWWQLTWRAPGIKDGTLLMAEFPEDFQLQQDYEAWGPVNLIYRPGPAVSPAISSEVLNPSTAYDILKKTIQTNPMRDVPMHRDYTKLLLISIPSASACIHVLDGTLPIYSENDTALIRETGSYSRIDQITPSGTAPIPPAPIFGAEPPHNWCYYYQKAALARQLGDWETIGKLYDETQSYHLKAADPSEFFPFIEGLVNLGRVDDAKVIYNKEIKGRPSLRLPMCESLAKDPGYPADFGYKYSEIFGLVCK